MPDLKLIPRKTLLTALICSSLRNGNLKEGLQTFQQGLQESETMVNIDVPCFLHIFSAFSKHDLKHRNNKEAKRMHIHAISNGFENDLMVCTSLIHMYGKLNDASYACTIFNSMETKNVVAWNAIISSFVKTKESDKAIPFFEQMVCEGIFPVKVTFLAIINAQKDFDHGTRMHAIIVIRNEISLDISVQTCLVSMYGRFGRPDISRKIFDVIVDPNIISWTTIISVCANNKQTKEAFDLLSQMQHKKKLAPNDVTLVSLLGLCANEGLLIEGMHLHALILAFGFDFLIVVTNALLNFYSKCGNPIDAHHIFLAMPEKDVISWNIMIAMTDRRNAESLMFFKEMCYGGFTPSKATFMSILDACANLSNLHEARRAHFYIVDAGLDGDQSLENVIINVYGQCKSLKDAQAVFSKNLKCDIVTWNTMLGACLHNRHGEDALCLYRQMISEGVMPNNLTFPMVFTAFSSVKGLLSIGRELHACTMLDSDILSEITIQNSILNMYSRCENPLAIRDAFSNMPEPNVVSWNILMSAYAQNNCREVLHLFKKMLCEGILPDETSFVLILNACANEEALAEGKRIHANLSGGRQSLYLWNALIHMYHKCNDLDETWQTFSQVIKPDCVTWNSIISAFIEDDLSFAMFNQMLQNGIMPDQITFLTLLSACASQATLGIGKQIHARIISESKMNALDIVVNTNLVKMYGCCGEVVHASMLFHEMVDRNVLSWNSMLSTCAQHGLGKVTLELFRRMLKEHITPDEITFTCLFSALSHDGLIAETSELFCIMKSTQGFELIEDHYNCMIDALGRAGRLAEAEQVLKDSPFQYKLLPVMTLLGSCKIHMDFGRGNDVIRQNLHFDQIGVAAYIKLLNNFNAIEIQGGELSV